MPRSGLDLTKHKRKNDLFLIGGFLIVALFCFLFMKFQEKEGATAVVTVEGEEVLVLSLEEDITKEVKTGTHYNIIKVSDGAVQMIEADCSDKICVNHKPISNEGETIVCLPHKLVVEIKNGSDTDTESTENGFDAISK